MGLHMWEPKVYGLPHHWTSTSQLSPIHSIATTLYFIKNNPIYNLQVQKLFEHYNSMWHVTDYFLIWPAFSGLCNQCNLCIHNLILETTFVALLQKKLLADFCKNSHSLQVLLARSVQINVCYKISFLKDVPKWACGFVGCGQHTLSESSGYIFIPNSKYSWFIVCPYNALYILAWILDILYLSQELIHFMLSFLWCSQYCILLWPTSSVHIMHYKGCKWTNCHEPYSTPSLCHLIQISFHPSQTFHQCFRHFHHFQTLHHFVAASPVTRRFITRHPSPVTRHIVTPSFRLHYSSLSVSVIIVLRYFGSLPPLLSSEHHSRLCGWMITT